MPPYLSELNPQQLEAVLHGGSPLLILAGAGSGKTRVLTAKIAHLVAGGADPRSILAVAFTNKAAEEMRDRVARLVPEAGEVMIKTFHAFGAWLLRRNARALGLAEPFTIYDEEDSLSLLEAVLDRDLPRSQLKELATRISRAKDAGLGWRDDLSAFGLSCQAAGLEFPEVYRLYQERLESTGNVDFGDLILLPVRLLEGSPEVRRRINQRFRFILVDEYQDSNHAQFRLLSLLYDGENTLCVVGDEDQSIYGFRGAELGNILGFAEAFAGARVIRLEQNYRSTQNILQAATGVVENNFRRLGKTLWTRNPLGAPVVYTLLEDQDQEARFCAELLKDGDYGNTAILYRMNFQSRVFETMFSRLGIPYRVVGTWRFYEREEVKDALAYLSLLANPQDEVAFRRAVNKPRRGVGARSVEAVLARRRSGGQNLLGAARAALASLPGQAGAGVRAFLNTMEGLAEKMERLSLEGLVRAVILESGLHNWYRGRDKLEETGRAANLEELVSAAAEYAPGREGLAQLLEGIELGSHEEDPFSQSGRVTLITAHNTKGLEFDRVIITGLEEGIFPHCASAGALDFPAGDRNVPAGELDLEEERRLFYVGATRARRALYLTAARRRRLFGRLAAGKPSQFLGEIPVRCLQRTGAQAQQDGLPLGSGVYHDEYGPGIVTQKWTSEGVDMVAVRFDSGRIARFPVKYTRLERISRET